MTTSKSERRERRFTLADGLHSAAIHLLRRVRTEDAVLGISPARLSALSVVVFRGPLALNELAAAEQVRPPTMSRLVVELERAGLVTRNPSPDDGRRLEIRATGRGRKLLDRGRRRRVAALAEALADLDPASLDTLERATELLSRLLASTSPQPLRPRRPPR